MWLAERWRKVAERHQRALDGAPGYAPLLLSLRGKFSINYFEYFDDYRAMFEREVDKARGMQAIGSDAVPCLVVRHDPVVLPSLFGAPVENIGGRPMFEPFLDGPESLERLDVPDVVDAVAANVG